MPRGGPSSPLPRSARKQNVKKNPRINNSNSTELKFTPPLGGMGRSHRDFTHERTRRGLLRDEVSEPSPFRFEPTRTLEVGMPVGGRGGGGRLHMRRSDATGVPLSSAAREGCSRRLTRLPRLRGATCMTLGGTDKKGGPRDRLS